MQSKRDILHNFAVTYDVSSYETRQKCIDEVLQKLKYSNKMYIIFTIKSFIDNLIAQYRWYVIRKEIKRLAKEEKTKQQNLESNDWDFFQNRFGVRK